MRTTAPPNRSGPTVVDTRAAAALLGVAPGTLWTIAREGGVIELGGETVRPIRIGTSVRWPMAPIARALELDESDPSPADATSDDPGRDDTSNAGAA